jgi:hypothetical protein
MGFPAIAAVTEMDSGVTPPPPFEQPAPDRIVIREGGGCLSLFGLPFLAAGVFLVLVALQVIPMSNRDEVPGWAWPLLFLMGLVFAAVGANLVFGRRWITLDAGRGIIARQAGLLVPIRREEHRAGDYVGVRLGFEEGDSDTSDRYPIELVGKEERQPITIASPLDFAAGRDQAEFIARFLDLPFTDATTDHAVTLTPGRAEDPSPIGYAPRPPILQSRVEQVTGGVRIIFPAPGFRWHRLLGFLPPAAILAYGVPFLKEFFDRTRTPDYVQYFFVCFILLFFVALPSLGTLNGIIRSVRGRTVVEASGAGVRIKVQAAWRKKLTAIAAAEIFGVDYGPAEGAWRTAARSARTRYARRPSTSLPPAASDGPGWLRRLIRSKGVLVKCRQGIIAFGAGLPDDELRYLSGLLERALRGPKR